MKAVECAESHIGDQQIGPIHLQQPACLLKGGRADSGVPRTGKHFQPARERVLVIFHDQDPSRARATINHRFNRECVQTKRLNAARPSERSDRAGRASNVRVRGAAQALCGSANENYTFFSASDCVATERCAWRTIRRRFAGERAGFLGRP
jgi:hypothetical protein